jgi:LexA-binding, inner membrane-associated putative hydrolase
MAGFKTHVSTSSLLGTAYAGFGYAHGMPPDTAMMAGAMCGFAGMLPDLDSDSGVPLREAMSFTAATVPMLLLNRLASIGLRYDQMAIIAVVIYFFFRFGLSNMIRKYTVHRGMFHSIPALLIVGGIAYLICGGAADTTVRLFKAGGVMLGYLSHLVLDEIYAFEWRGGRWQMKKSFGTAMKLWGDDGWSNFSTYSKLLGVGAMIFGEGNLMHHIQTVNPQLAQTIQQLEQQYPELTAQLSSVVTAARAQVATGNNPYAAGQPGAFPPSHGNTWPQQSFPPQGYPLQGYPPQAYGQPPAPNPQLPYQQPTYAPQPPANYQNQFPPPYQQGPQSQATTSNNNWNTAQRPAQQYPQ